MKTSDRLVILATLVIIAGVAIFALKPNTPRTLFAAPDPEQSIIFVNGEATLMVKPDTVLVTVGVTTEANTAQAAMNQNAAKMNALLEQLKASGIDEDAMKTVRYHVYPRYDYSAQSQKLIGFTVSNALEITLDAGYDVGQLLDKAASAGANTIDSVTYLVRDTQKYRDEALRLAMDDARHRADVLAQSAGVSIKGVKSIQENSGSSPIVPLSVRKEVASLDQAMGATPVMGGDMQIRFYVAVEYTF